MTLHFFTPKILGSLLIGAGALSIGGVIYWYQMPRTWRELLTKEGFVFLSAEHDYKGMWNDQKGNTDLKKDTSLSDATDSNVHDKAKEYCGKLDEKLPESSDSTTKQKLVVFCTTDGIKTVKARLIQNKKTGWIVGNNDEDKWKAIFAVYRYDPKFINWLKEADKEANASLNQESSVEEYAKLKTACEKLLKEDYRKVSSDQIRYGSWWCVELGYDTIKKKIQQEDPNWTEREQENQEWESLKTEWENTDLVKKWANKAKSQKEGQELSVDSLKALCGSSNVNAKLSDNESYRDKYIVIKSVCKK